MKACLQLQLAKIASLSATACNPITTLFPRIIVLDSTQWKLNETLKKSFRGFGGGASKAACKLQTAIDAISGKLLLLDYHNATRPDQRYGKKLLNLVFPSDLILFDLGYYCVNLFKEINKIRAFFICPIYYHATIKSPHSKNSNPVASFLTTSKTHIIDAQFLIGSQSRIQLRIVAVKHSEEKAAKLRRKLRESYRKQRAGQPSELRLLFCDWTTVITNISADQIKTNDILNLYRTRWQIEIFFRDAKSHLNLSANSTSKRERFEVQLLAILFLTAFLCFIQGRFNQSNSPQNEISLNKLIKRFGQSVSFIYACLVHQNFQKFGTILEHLLSHSIKFHQLSRLTPRQIIQRCFVLS